MNIHARRNDCESFFFHQKCADCTADNVLAQKTKIERFLFSIEHFE